eukprot:CAMPEP_0198131662 /NCGR_PEP_ID=MMETSP1442-20131203/56669_1 /TAXON_ID= /ORGANISM="Craspedostauros australis, Strain CCMP3328" /LENGTH=177 /DNA_ID=CAMNT_0043792517 /DNA_START=42 /DNA_END=571 /DNA_ORIENTATION=+
MAKIHRQPTHASGTSPSPIHPKCKPNLHHQQRLQDVDEGGRLLRADGRTEGQHPLARLTFDDEQLGIVPNIDVVQPQIKDLQGRVAHHAGQQLGGMQDELRGRDAAVAGEGVELEQGDLLLLCGIDALGPFPRGGHGGFGGALRSDLQEGHQLAFPALRQLVHVESLEFADEVLVVR